MARVEIFPNPTVKQVIFQIRFPNLFYIEQKVGEYQLKIMRKFPKSKLVQLRQFLVAVGPSDADDVPDDVKDKSGMYRKTWQFESEEGVVLNINSDSLDLTSTRHKSYDNPDAPMRFRDAIKEAVDAFIATTDIPVITRIGLRYIDECPIPARDDAKFREYYDSPLPLERFPLRDAIELAVRARVRRGKLYLFYQERVTGEQDDPRLILDFDGYAENIEAAQYLNVADQLHELVADEYDKSIKEPVREHMRRKDP